MTLDNLLKIGQLKPHATDPAEIGYLLATARRNLHDARVEDISTENRFDAAYECIMQSALAALMANGFRPDTKALGHHQTVIQEVEPIETFDKIVTDERNHSIYHLSPQVLEYFETDLIGLTATPNEHAFGFCAHKPTGPPIRPLAMRPESVSAGGTADKVWRCNATSGNCAALARSTMEDRSRFFWY